VPRRPRIRLDELVLLRGLAATRSAARGLIMAGQVLVDGQVSDKAGTPTPEDASVTLKERPRFVSRAGDKLDAALDTFGVDVAGVSALDVGASTGGFVDCMLQRGALRVIALDVGKGQLDSKMRGDERVHVIENLNARYLEPSQLPWIPDLLTMDVSFISVTKVLPAVVACMADRFRGVILIKPQFEAGPRDVGKGGIVRDIEVHRRVLRETAEAVIGELGIDLVAICRSAVPGTGGNREFFFHLERGGEKGLGLDTLDMEINTVLEGEAPEGGGDGVGP
jgi:23S rRNA (cytidine1920-2'-O)/16S rRNA (cytidine1409-2'-O)-methyltransferase